MRLSSQQKALIDEYGELHRQLAATKPLQDRFRAVGQQIESWFEGQPADQPFSESGERYNVQVSPRENVRTISDLAQVFKLLGKERFLTFATFPLKALDANFTPIEQANQRLTTSERTGKRRLTPVLRSPAAGKLPKAA